MQFYYIKIFFDYIYMLFLDFSTVIFLPILYKLTRQDHAWAKSCDKAISIDRLNQRLPRLSQDWSRPLRDYKNGRWFSSLLDTSNLAFYLSHHSAVNIIYTRVIRKVLQSSIQTVSSIFRCSKYLNKQRYATCTKLFLISWIDINVKAIF